MSWTAMVELFTLYSLGTWFCWELPFIVTKSTCELVVILGKSLKRWKCSRHPTLVAVLRSSGREINRESSTQDVTRPVGSTSVFHIGPWRGRGRGWGLGKPFHTGSYKQKCDSFSKDTSRMLAWCWIQSWKQVELMEATAVSLGTVHVTCSTQPFTGSGPLYNTLMASPAHWRRWGTLQGRPWSTAIFGSAGSIPQLVSPSGWIVIFHWIKEDKKYFK